MRASSGEPTWPLIAAGGAAAGRAACGAAMNDANAKTNRILWRIKFLPALRLHSINTRHAKPSRRFSPAAWFFHALRDTIRFSAERAEGALTTRREGDENEAQIQREDPARQRPF
jgi:hypothetical protein